MIKPLVAIVLGSDSDLVIMSETANVLEKAGVPFEFVIASAHRCPDYVKESVKAYEKEGVKVFIAAAGLAAALPGVIAAETTLPVIGVPLNSSSLNGLDSLYAIVQMPGGVPVGTMAIGRNGAVNAGMYAISILALRDEKLAKWLSEHKKKLYDSVVKKSIKLKEKGYKKYMEEMGK